MIINILLDECLPKKLKYRVEELDPNFFFKTVPEMGWASIANGALLVPGILQPVVHAKAVVGNGP